MCRSAEEADAQSLRCAILLDELDVQGKGSPDPRMGRILVELKTSNAVRLLNYCCSTRVQALPTSLANARRSAPQVILDSDDSIVRSFRVLGLVVVGSILGRSEGCEGMQCLDV